MCLSYTRGIVRLAGHAKSARRGLFVMSLGAQVGYQTCYEAWHNTPRYGLFACWIETQARPDSHSSKGRSDVLEKNVPKLINV
jgi:hypothetical protein